MPFMTGLYTATMAGFAALASGTAVPISRLAGWELALGAGALIALIAAGVWAVRLREPDLATGALPSRPSAAHPVRPRCGPPPSRGRSPPTSRSSPLCSTCC
ncbi:hypothetical protein [Nesterenkonia pannonica]|uniref:hypothetical protein n=1 Tax=Nesterenkonia pannonica TaxID=1548602 RepID=UPI0021649BFC|nr:hypothetical protein [Nesterenkonia pannonica]